MEERELVDAILNYGSAISDYIDDPDMYHHVEVARERLKKFIDNLENSCYADDIKKELEEILNIGVDNER